MTRIISIVGGLQPSAPTIGTATGGDTSASVAFTASSYIGKGTITYTATSSPGGLTATGASSPLTVSGLSNGTAYTFTVVGNTNYGVASVASASSNSVTPAASGSFESIATATLSSPATTITLSSISQSYQHLLIRWWTLPSGSNETEVKMRFNGTGSTNYIYNTMEAISDGGSQASLGWLADNKFNVSYTYGTFSTGAPTIANFLIPNYSSTTKYKTGIGWWGTTGPTVGGAVNMAMAYGDTAAITQVQILTNGNNLATGSKLQLYGIKGS